MPNTCLDLSDFIIPAFNTNSQTSSLVTDFHPGQVRLLDYLVNRDGFPFRQRDDVIRWCVAWGVHTLLGPLPSVHFLMEVKMNILQDDRFELQKDCLGNSVKKYLTAGDKESARRLVALSFEDYCRIPNEYWRMRWLSTLNTPIEMLRQQGVKLCSDIEIRCSMPTDKENGNAKS